MIRESWIWSDGHNAENDQTVVTHEDDGSLKILAQRDQLFGDWSTREGRLPDTGILILKLQHLDRCGEGGEIEVESYRYFTTLDNSEDKHERRAFPLSREEVKGLLKLLLELEAR